MYFIVDRFNFCTVGYVHLTFILTPHESLNGQSLWLRLDCVTTCSIPSYSAVIQTRPAKQLLLNNKLFLHKSWIYFVKVPLFTKFSTNSIFSDRRHNDDGATRKYFHFFCSCSCLYSKNQQWRLFDYKKSSCDESKWICPIKAAFMRLNALFRCWWLLTNTWQVFINKLTVNSLGLVISYQISMMICHWFIFVKVNTVV